MKKVTKKQQKTAEFLTQRHLVDIAETINATGKATRKGIAALKREAHNLGIDFKGA